jgi:hypothetical protein
MASTTTATVRILFSRSILFIVCSRVLSTSFSTSRFNCFLFSMVTRKRCLLWQRGWLFQDLLQRNQAVQPVASLFPSVQTSQHYRTLLGEQVTLMKPPEVEKLQISRESLVRLHSYHSKLPYRKPWHHSLGK